MLLKGDAATTAAQKRKDVASAATIPKTPGIHYAIVDTTTDGGQDTERIVGGQTIRLENRVGFTEDPDLAARCKEAGLFVCPREKQFASGKTFHTVPALPWHKETHEPQADTDRPGNDGPLPPEGASGT